MSKKEEQLNSSPPPESTESKPGLTIVFKEGDDTSHVNDFFDFFKQISSTGTTIQGAIDGINESVLSIHSATASYEQSSNVEDRLIIIDNEIRSIKNLLPQLEQSKASLSHIEEFIKNNAVFLTNSIVIDGRLRSIEGEIISLTKRLEFVEGKKILVGTRLLH